MPKKALVLVESPNKKRKIQFILDKLLEKGHVKDKCLVLPTIGHVYDLPTKELGVDLETFELKTVPNPDKGRVLKQIEAAAKSADKIILATDPDREGEAIGYYVQRYLKDAGIEGPYSRVEFHEITISGIKKAFASPREVDMSRVAAQQARRALDRLCGYRISPFLWRELGSYKLAAGRVQSYALDLLVENSLKRRNFIPEKRWYAVLHLSDGRYTRSTPLKTEEEAKALAKKLSHLKSAWKETEEEQNPLPPFTTARLLQDAGKRWGYSSQALMSACQDLFAQGKITYHRTDSTSLSWGAVGGMRKQLQKDKFTLSAKPRSYSGMKGKHAQGAHEAIRPTHYDVKPIKAKAGKEGKTGKYANKDLVYRLIYARALATQLESALWTKQTLTFTMKGDKEPLWTFHGKILKRRGWYEIDWELLGDANHKLDPKAKPAKVTIESDFSEPPQPLTEAYLIQRMEKEGVGRPSTYASIMTALQRHQYITRSGRVIFPTPVGEAVTVFLRKAFPQLLDAGFTSKMEGRLDKIEKDAKHYHKVLRRYNSWITRTLSIQPKRRYAIDAHCPKCKLASLKLKFAWKGGTPFLLCRHCKEIYNPDFNLDGSIKPFKERQYPGPCLLCTKEKLVLKQSKFGFYVVCSKCEAIQKGAATISKEERADRAKEREKYEKKRAKWEKKKAAKEAAIKKKSQKRWDKEATWAGADAAKKLPYVRAAHPR